MNCNKISCSEYFLHRVWMLYFCVTVLDVCGGLKGVQSDSSSREKASCVHFPLTEGVAIFRHSFLIQFITIITTRQRGLHLPACTFRSVRYCFKTKMWKGTIQLWIRQQCVSHEWDFMVMKTREAPGSQMRKHVLCLSDSMD